MNIKNSEKDSLKAKKKKRFFSKKEKKKVVEEPIELNEVASIKRTGFNLVEVIIIMVITSMLGVLVGCFVTFVNYNDGRTVGCNEIREDTKEFSKIYDNVLNEFYNEVDRKGLLKSAIVGMVDYLDDPYAEYLDEAVVEEMNEMLLGEFVGMGVQITMEDGGKTTVVGVYKDSPASKAGILVGDVIVKFGDVSLEGLSSKELSDLIVVDEVGEEVLLTVKRNGEELTINVISDVVEFTSVSSFIKYIDSKTIGYISISNFAENTVEQFKEHYNYLVNENISGLIIDVRGSSGGNLDSAAKIADLFLDKNVVIFQKDTDGKIKKILDKSEKEIDIKIVILTNNCTRSASEVFVSALKENLFCDVVGIETGGNGTIQKMYELSDGSYIKFTTEKWLTSKGENINEIGIAPTHYIDSDEKCNKNQSVENDTQLIYAFDLFK